MVYNWHDVPLYDTLSEAGVLVGKRKKKDANKFPTMTRKNILFNIVCAFDTETSTIWLDNSKCEKKPHSFVYIWQYQLGENYTIVGRTMDELMEFFVELVECCERYQREHYLPEIPGICCHIHNSSYEFQFLSDPNFYKFADHEVFLFDKRGVLLFSMFGCLEFRCSYKHSNMSLDKYCKQMGCTQKKLNGQLFDYKKVRYPWTELSEYEMAYCTHDVLALVEALTLQMQKDGDDLLSLPLTSTGYVRRNVKKACQPLFGIFKNQKPDLQAYRLLKSAFRGGNTHANPAYVGKILEGKQAVQSYDMASCYPAQQMLQLFPSKKFTRIPDRDLTGKHITWLIRKNIAVVMRVEFTDLELKDRSEPVPYLPFSKCTKYTGAISRYDKETRTKVPGDIRLDNGRVLYIPYCETVLLDVDFMILASQYKWSNIKIVEAMQGGIKQPLPQEIKSVVMEYFEGKTKLKARSKTDKDIAYYYMRYKNWLNSIFGLFATDVCKSTIYYSSGDFLDEYEMYVKEAIKNKIDNPYAYADEKLSSSYEEKLVDAWLPFQYGCYVSAYGRAALQIGIDKVKNAAKKDKNVGFVYCDTDSIKFFGDVDFSEINEHRKELSIAENAVAEDENGESHYMGVFERETFPAYKRFVSLGAKRYCYIEEDKSGNEHMHITVSGVTHREKLHEVYRRRGTMPRARGVRLKKYKLDKSRKEWCNIELGKIENFKEGFTWREAGKSNLIYNDNDDFDITIDGHKLHIGKNVSIIDGEYTLTIEPIYNALLTEINTFGHWRRERRL